ncbi:type VII secretion-associated serine protease mycosin [Yinghuangia seranimata]|uniref:type VII secretion-associated serine protease mycosin n=1 Tax=Yinghuangia seranimata TaxID=408067 RepID=UPI00248CAE27|nr:type VII secretion-associated serine protease mycosin [Yinghuangia seranimata]MDI2132469.1 type VII secretion-associated serine protease mycosin [Yinghuangia seranimata]
MHPVRRTRPGATLLALSLLCSVTAPAAASVPAPDLRLAAETDCRFPAKPLEGKPWSLQRVVLDQMWQVSTGKGVVVAVIDSGVDANNPQLTQALSADGKDFVPPAAGAPAGPANGTTDENGHGTMVAGIIAARPDPSTGFVGLAKDATILPIKQNGGTDQQQGTSDTLAQAIDYAVSKGAKVINISQETGKDPTGKLLASVTAATNKDVVIVAAAGNSGDKDNLDTLPAGMAANNGAVLAVGASDRNNDRAPFSQNKNYVSVLAPGVDMWSTVPKGGHCKGDGTSFSAPYVAGVVALLRAAHPYWKAQQVVSLIEQTAQRGWVEPLTGVGWGVVDPLRAVGYRGEAGFVPEGGRSDVVDSAPVNIEPLHLGPTRNDQDREDATAVLMTGLGCAVLIASAAVVLRDFRHRRLHGPRTVAVSTGPGIDGFQVTGGLTGPIGDDRYDPSDPTGQRIVQASTDQ